MNTPRTIWGIQEFNPVDGYFALITRNARLFAKTFSRAEAHELVDAMTNAERATAKAEGRHTTITQAEGKE